MPRWHNLVHGTNPAKCASLESLFPKGSPGSKAEKQHESPGRGVGEAISWLRQFNSAPMV